MAHLPEAPSKTSRFKRLGMGCGLSLLVLSLLFIFAFIESRRLLEARVSKVDLQIEAITPTLRYERRYPFQSQSTGEASRFYRAIDWAASKANLAIKTTTEDLPPQPCRRAEFDETHPTMGLNRAAKVLALALESTQPLSTKERAEFSLAQKFSEDHGLYFIELIQQGVRSSYVRWPADFRDGLSMELPNYLVHKNAAYIAVWNAARSDPKDAIERALEVIAFGHDHCAHPTLVGTVVGAALQKVGLQSLERRLTFEGQPPTATDLRRIIDALAVIPTAAPRVVEFETLGNDAVIANFVRSRDISPLMPLPSSVANLAFEPIMIWKWRDFETFREGYQEIWNAPLFKAHLVSKDLADKIETRKNNLARNLYTNVLTARMAIVECQARKRLILNAAAATLFRMKNGAWPKSTTELGNFYSNKPQASDTTPEAPIEWTVESSGLTLSADMHTSTILLKLPTFRPPLSSR